MNNKEFLNVIKESFKTYLDVGTSRSTAKLKSLHGSIAKDLQKILGNDFAIMSQGFGDDCEGGIDGRYYLKKTDITILKNSKRVAGYAVKFVMRNYSQNSNNYFENMLGETANIRANNIPYFQIFITFDKIPYYKKDGNFQKYDLMTEHTIKKYVNLSNDNISLFFHTPNKTLFILLHLKEKSENYIFKNSDDYAKYYLSIINDKDSLSYSSKIKDNFGNAIIYNDYENFLMRTKDCIFSMLK